MLFFQALTSVQDREGQSQYDIFQRLKSYGNIIPRGTWELNPVLPGSDSRAWPTRLVEALPWPSTKHLGASPNIIAHHILTCLCHGAKNQFLQKFEMLKICLLARKDLSRIMEALDPAIQGNRVEFRPASNGTSPRLPNQHVQYVCVGETIKNK